MKIYDLKFEIEIKYFKLKTIFYIDVICIYKFKAAILNRLRN